MAQNKPDGFQCVSCAWAKPADRRPFEFCENGASHPLRSTDHRIGEEFFTNIHARISRRGRIMTSKSKVALRIRCDGTKQAINTCQSHGMPRFRNRKAIEASDPKCVCYTSGRASLETSYMFQLFARLHGHNNLPDSAICTTKARRWACRKASELRWAPPRSRISSIAT